MLGLLSLSLVLLLTACRGVASPKGWASPQFVGDIFLSSPNHKTVVAADLQANTRKWTFPPAKSKISLTAVYGTPAVSAQTVVVGGYNGTLYALNLSDGSEKWSKETQGHIIGAPTIDSGAVFVGSSDRCLYSFALDDDGSQRFSPFCTGEKIWSTPVVSNGIVYFGSMDKKMYAVDASTGKSRWSQPFQADGAIASTAAIDNGTVYVGAFDRYMYALDASNGDLRWRFKADDWIWDRPLVSGGIVYFGSLSGTIYAVDASSGELRWDKPFEGKGVVRGGPVIVDSTLVVATDQGNVYGLDAGSGVQQWTTKASSGVLSDLVVNGGSVYFSTKSGAAQKVDPENGAINDVPLPE